MFHFPKHIWDSYGNLILQISILSGSAIGLHCFNANLCLCGCGLGSEDRTSLLECVVMFFCRQHWLWLRQKGDWCEPCSLEGRILCQVRGRGERGKPRQGWVDEPPPSASVSKYHSFCVASPMTTSCCNLTWPFLMLGAGSASSLVSLP